ncbi:MAG: hypothetical protein Q9225_005494 [Loekoesia sp. 1 TL-2023]
MKVKISDFFRCLILFVISSSILEPFFRGVLDLVNANIAHQNPEHEESFRYIERFLKLAFKCGTSDTPTCSWEAVKFFAEWQLDRLAKRLPSFCRGTLKGPGQQLIEFWFGASNTLNMRTASASDLNGIYD